MGSPAVLTKPRYNGSITFGEGYVIPEVKRGIVTLLGSANRCRVTVLNFDDVADGEKGEQLDILHECSVEQEGDTLVFTGKSYRMLHEQKLKDNTITFRLKMNGKCAGCGYS